MENRIVDVAKMAGVSAATVSRVLRGDSRISDACRTRVLTAAKEANYRPLRRRSNPNKSAEQAELVVGVLTLGMSRSLETLPVVGAAIHGAEAALTAAGASMVFQELIDVTAMPANLDVSKFKGLILKGALQGNLINHINPKLKSRLMTLPTVWLLGRPTDGWGDACCADDFQVGKLAAERLLRAGHRHVGFLSPKSGHVNFSRRQAGFTWTAQEAGVQVQQFVDTDESRWKLPLQAAQDVKGVAKLMDDVLAVKPKITAIFVPADNIAALVYRAAAPKGIVIGKDISVISANNERGIRDVLYPDLTTIDVHANKIGQRAVDLLLMRIAGGPGKSAMSGELNLSLVPEVFEGHSVADLSRPRPGA
jgi:LacI family transcriptional regulator